MIAGIFHSGSGLGNQLHRYVATRVLALDKGYTFGMVAPENFKGSSFMNLDMGVAGTVVGYDTEYPSGRVVPHLTQMHDDYLLWEEKTNYYNPEFNFIEDNTIIDGEFQDERYFSHRLSEVDEWLRVEKLVMPNDLCVIGFRGGEFYTVSELGLPKEYFELGIRMMKEINPSMKFEVHTDDEVLAKQFFPDYKIIHDIGINWRSIRSAKYAIVANSSFYILPRLLRHHKPEYTHGPVTVSPRYWDRYNIKKWERPYNYYKAFQYI